MRQLAVLDVHIAFQVADLATAMSADAGIGMHELRVDGGAAANDLLMQFQADVMQLPTVRPKNVETTALGAAYLAGLATGFWGDTNELSSLWQKDRVFEPSMPADRVAKMREEWSRAVERSRDWARD